MEIGLGDALQALRREITESMLGSAHELVRFRVESVELELQVTATRTGGGEGGVKFWILTAGAKREVESSSVQKVTLHLSAVTADGGEVLTGDTLDDVPL